MDSVDSVDEVAQRRVVSGVRRGPSSTSRLVGYVIAVLVNAVMLYLINRSPGWQAVPFLTDDTPRVLPLVNASLIVGVVANLLYVLWDPRWLRALGDIVTTSIGLAALVGLWNVFPVEFESTSFDWALVARWVIGVGIGGSIIGILVALSQLVRALLRPSEHDGP